MLRRLYDWTLSLAASRHAATALGGVSFIESSVFPIPPDTLLIPMVIARRDRAWWYATLCTITSVLGGLAGYLIGAFLFDELASPILSAYGYLDKFEEFRGWYNEWGVWIVLFAGVTPFPYKVVTIASGATGLNVVVFMLSSIVARGLRFFIVAGLLYRFGPPIRDFIERRLGLVFTVCLVLLIGGFVAARYASDDAGTVACHAGRPLPPAADLSIVGARCPRRGQS
ncbi:SNARE associated Golgi protein [Methylobrevis pamukkalensis]|uniref:SNARE associated Golgi protein n=1 Tax=Methylobrevis pamukkalensis TaxID=1439726 RepID=A0A1E3H8P4_9HYPH|nr:SNARE associated Golgi protein [Methylobrevis pamukkalensis]